MTLIFGFFLLTLLLIAAIATVQSKNLFVSVMLSGMFSLLLAANFFLLDAADVALTEAAVGAGISTVLLLGALAITAKHEKSPSSNRVVALIVVTIATLVLLYTTFDNPDFGDPNAPVQQHVSPWYLDKTAEAIDIPNVVTAVLGSFRGYDTLGEVFVVFTAGIGVLFLLGTPPGRFAQTDPYKSTDPKGLRHYLIPRIVGRMLIPFILLFGLYVQFHGEYGPGGGFQAGALIAASIILYALLEGEDRALKVIPRSVLIGLIAGGALLYGTVGLFGIFLGSNFLDYSVLSSNSVKGQQLGVLLIEAGVGITVTGVLLSIFHAFAARGKF
ncbi:MAG: multicomponent Na+:H+ antiporter subunit B [Candidatus Azotimanducaceae bacterium]|jgi:multicomponent Na+:H+ antiporter subunit B